MSHQENITRIRAVNNALGDLRTQVVFVGGATVSLYTDPKAAQPRPTDDVDVVIELWAHKDYAKIDEKLRSLGFRNDQDSKVICRYIIEGIIVDVMPTHDDALGFSNKWYPQGFATAIDYDLGESKIRIFSPPYFIASKLEAFKGRGQNDGRTSSDFEDIVFVMENSKTIWDEMKEADKQVKKYLQETFQTYLNQHYFQEWIDAHAGYGSPPATYFIMEKLDEFVKAY
jgi:predicted nucleotidyltransferase